MQLSLMLNGPGMSPEERIKLASSLGLDGVQLPVGAGDWAPEALNRSARHELRTKLEDLGLRVTAVAAGGGRFVYDQPAQLGQLLDRVRAVVELAADLGTSVWQSHIGRVPEERNDPRRIAMVHALRRVTEIALDHGVCLAVETGPESPFVLLSLIEEVGPPGLRVNYDPANFIIWPALLDKERNRPYSQREALETFLPTEGVGLLGPHIVHVHAKDALVNEAGESIEVPIGEGWVRWDRLFELLHHHGFEGAVAIEREAKGDWPSQVRQAVDYLRTHRQIHQNDLIPPRRADPQSRRRRSGSTQ